MRGHVVASLVILSGCSRFTSGVAPRWEASQPVTCSTSVAAPLLDGLTAVAGAVLGIGMVGYVIAEPCHWGDSGGPESGGDCSIVLSTAAVGLGGATLYGWSAIGGLGKRSRCRDAEGKHRDWLRRQATGDGLISPSNI